MSFETYKQFYDGGDRGTTIRVGGARASFSFFAEPKKGKKYRLFTTGESEQCYWWKDEPDGPMQYRTITDALDTQHAVRERYCLNFSSKKPEEYLRRIYKKIMWTDPLKLGYMQVLPRHTEWQMGVRVTAKDLSILEGGYLQMRIDIHKKKDGIDPRSVEHEPEVRIVIPIPTGTYAQTELCQCVNIPADTAHVGVFIEGKRYSGECYFEEPYLKAGGNNLLPPFDEPVSDAQRFDWSAQYLSRKEWPEFRIRLNGKKVFEGEIFERSHRRSEWSIDLPAKWLKAENEITYELISDYHEPTPYTIYEAGLIEQPDESLSLIAVSEIANAGGKARVLVRTKRPNTRVRLKTIDPHLAGDMDVVFAEAGLHGLLIDCLAPCEHAAFELRAGKTVIRSEVPRVAVRAEDAVVTGTGDMIYIHQDDAAMEEYLSWYLSNHVGDLVTIRPTYRWSGTRTLNKPMWKWVVRLFNELELKYVLMGDGREIPGRACNPDEEMLAGKGYLGRQEHELDGASYYWPNGNAANTPTNEAHANLSQMSAMEDPLHTDSARLAKNSIYDESGLYRFTVRSRIPRDYKEARRMSIERLHDAKRDYDTRHTGPSCMFKYLGEAGYSWLGAETMYSSMEPIMSFLRGYAKSVDMKTYGVHHALQWASQPIDPIEHVRRYRLALYTSYMLGATDINTEEGLWRMEEYYVWFNRFGETCKAHLKEQQDFYRYVQSHSRTGTFRTPYAILHGRDDGCTFFGKNRTWGFHIPQTAAEDSWDLITAFYPKSDPVKHIYAHNCPTDQPVGYYTGTPYGQPDFIPVETGERIWKDYRFMAFLAYNRCESADAEKLIDYVKQGGKLLLTRAHLTETSDMEEIRRGELKFAPCALSFANGAVKFADDAVNGKKISVCVNPQAPDEVLLRTDSGAPLLCRYRVGKGEVLLYNVKDYPSVEAIRAQYEQTLTDLIREATEAERVWARTGDDVEFVVYDQEDGTKHVYFLAVDWYREPEFLRHAELCIDGKTYGVYLPFGRMIKCVTKDGIAAWAESEDGEVLSITDAGITVQGTGEVIFRVARDGARRDVTVDFKSETVQTLPL
ncbi:MAG: hypothetical protein IJW16_07960 [Clostridia bacterium]|nr:hypothetical protein [Clostridia bacterium]